MFEVFNKNLSVKNGYSSFFIFFIILIISQSLYASNKKLDYIYPNEISTELVINNQPYIIIIDAGHGGHDPGCKGSHSIEKDISLKLALKIGDNIKIKNPNIKIIYTRDRDIFVPLHKRIDIANKNKADLFISVHCNSSSNKTARGTESFVMGLHRTADNLEVAKRENQVITLEDGYVDNYGEYDPNSPAGHIILSMFQNIHLDQSIEIAQKIEQNFSSRNHRKTRGVKQAGFVVLRNATMPSILIEAGFLTNKSDEKYLTSSEGQSKTAESISNAILSYVESVENQEISSEKKNSDLATNNMVKKHISTVSHKSSTANTTKNIPKSNNIKISATKSIREADKTPKATSRYRIQLAATTKKTIDTKKGKWADIKDLVITESDNLYKYYTGEFATKDNANREKLRLRSTGFKGAFVVSID